MKRNTKVLVISLLILLVIGLGLLWWVIAGAKENENKKTTEAEVEETLKEQNDTKEQDTEKQEIKEDDVEQIPEEDTQEPVTIVFSGDILLSSYVLNNYENSGISGVISEELQMEMQNADLTMVNEEFPFSTRGTQAADKQFTFRVDPSYVKILQEMGIDVVTLANNHALDYGKEALSDTFQTLDSAEIAYVGAGESKERAAQPYVTEMGGKTFGFLECRHSLLPSLV